jgi:serine phosphatase RsbU (regulator of sigma subunit)
MDDEFLRSTCRDEEHFRLVKELGFDSYVAVPLVTEGEPLGAIVLVSSGSGRRFGPAHVARVEDLAHQVAAVVDKARRYERERHTAAVLQSSLLPGALPDVKDVKLAWRYLASNTGIEAGGDFYDVVQLREGVLWLMVGDVAGHDRHSAAMMGHLRSVARALIGQVRTPRGLIQALQRSWATLDFDRLATSIFCRLAPSSGELLVASAGHPAPLLLSDGGAEFLPVEPASPLGVRGPRIPQWAGTLEPGSALLLYTDGVMQARDLHVSVDEGMARLAGVAESCRPEPDTLCDRVLAALGTDRSDDVALLAVAIDRPAGGSPGPDAGSRDREGAGSPKGTGSPES